MSLQTPDVHFDNMSINSWFQTEIPSWKDRGK